MLRVMFALRGPLYSHRLFFSLFDCSCASWMDMAAIDLHSRHPSVVEQDLLLVDPTRSQHREAWDRDIGSQPGSSISSKNRGA